jgi:hypothetical protein
MRCFPPLLITLLVAAAPPQANAHDWYTGLHSPEGRRLLRQAGMPPCALPAERGDRTGGDRGERGLVAGRVRQGATPLLARWLGPRLLDRPMGQALLPLHHPARHGRPRASSTLAPATRTSRFAALAS